MINDDLVNKLGKYNNTEYFNRKYIIPFKNIFGLCINYLLINN